ncbi:hypothetical protein Tco_0285140 [Tanacetum coccineum]
MYCSIVSDIASASSSSEYSWFFVRCKYFARRTPCHALYETRDKQSVGFVSEKGWIRCIGQRTGYAVSDRSGYVVFNCRPE